MENSIWNFMEKECPKSTKKPLRISVIAEAVPSEPLFMFVMTVIPDSLFRAAVETGIARPVSSINQNNGCINKWPISCPHIISF
jgi:hypothetical protein